MKAKKNLTDEEKWCIFIKYQHDIRARELINEITQREEGIAKAGEVVMSISQDERERARIMWEEKNALDLQDYIVTAQRQGHAQGMAQGLEQGREEVFSLLAQGLSIEEIKKRLEQK